MDKETLSNYGWIVICVLVLAVMIALATPFGDFVADAVKSTTQGLFDVNQKALNNTGLLTEEIPDQEFTDSNMQVINSLEGKNIAIFGTSITKGQGANTCYGAIIADKNEMTFTNYGIPGNNIIQTLEEYNKKYLSLSDFSSDDFIIFEGMANNGALPRGTLTPVGTTTFDTSTFIGALEEIIYKHKNTNNQAKFGFILTHYSVAATVDGSSAQQKTDSVWNDAIAVFEKYDVPYIDLRYLDVSMCDQIHPDNDGHQAIAVEVEEWLKRL